MRTLRTVALWASAMVPGVALAAVVSTQPVAPVVVVAPILPRCQEDQVLVGEGSFSAGRWTSYTCGSPVDDYVGIGDPEIGER